MRGILYARLKEFIRKPGTFFIFTAMSVLFAWIIGGSASEPTISVPIHGSESVKQSVQSEIDGNEYFSFQWVSEDELEEQVRQGTVDAGVLLYEDNFEIIVGVESTHLGMVRQTIQQVYADLQQDSKIEMAAEEAGLDAEEVMDDYHESLDGSIFDVETTSFAGEQDWVYDANIHRIGGFALFFAIYTIAYNVLHILVEKRTGMWDRMILSPAKKSEMYIGNLLYSFFEGYLQICIIFAIFHYGFGISFNGRFFEILLLLIPYVLAVVAMSILITAIVKNTEQFNAVISIVAVSLAMIGGAFWPIEIVQSEFLLFLAKLNPITYGLEIIQGLSVYGYSISEVIQPISILLFMTVLFMGVGIHLMERRHV